MYFKTHHKKQKQYILKITKLKVVSEEVYSMEKVVTPRHSQNNLKRVPIPSFK